MIYLDSSAALARILAEDDCPPDAFWRNPITSSSLLKYEIWNRLHARGQTNSHGPAADALLARVDLTELSSDVLARALEPFPLPVRTLDGLHLATMDWLRGNEPDLRLASYDKRMIACAEALGIGLWPI